MDNWLKDLTRMNPPIYTGRKIAKDVKEDCREAMLHDGMDFSRLMIRVQKVEERWKRKHTRAGKRSRQAKNNFF